MPVQLSSEPIGGPSSLPSDNVISTARNTVKSHVSFDPSAAYDSKYHGAEAWWSVGDFLQPGITHQNVGLSLAKHEDETWDLSDSLVDLYKEANRSEENSDLINGHDIRVDPEDWIGEDTSHGFVHVFKSDTDINPKLFPCTLTTSAQKLCIHCGMPPNSLHVQFNGDIIRRLDPFDCPLAIQNDYLQDIGYVDMKKIQEIGLQKDIAYLVKFYAGKPLIDSTYSRNQVSTFAYVRKGKLLYQWVRRLIVITGTRLLIYRDKTKSSKPTVVQLAKGSVEEVQSQKGHDYVIKLTSTLQGERSVYLSFNDEKEYGKWLRKTKKATAKLPTKADLSNCHLEFLPETVFINEELEILNLRHNVLKERPIEEDIYTIGWLDDLPRFYVLRSLNLADNDLQSFPMALCKMKLLTELNLASNKLEEVPADIRELENLQMLHLHNNHLTSLPVEMSQMRNLLVLVLAFNHFTTIPSVLLMHSDSLLRIDSLIMAGNRLENLPPELLNRMQHIKKIDLRMNSLSVSPVEVVKFHLLELVTHLDVRDNKISELDVRSLKALEYLNCSRNSLHTLQLNGAAIKTLVATQNELRSLSISPKPEWLVTVDVSQNCLTALPGWLSDCFFLVHLNASYNKLEQVPEKLFSGPPRLRAIHLSHNSIASLPLDVCNIVLEELSLDRNQLVHLPEDFFIKLPKLRFVCLTSNRLESIPEPNPNLYQNKLQELYLSANQLSDDIIPKICMFQRLKVLHMAYNRLTEIHERDLRKLENIQEMNISGNLLRHLPRAVGRHSKLQALRCNANLLKELPDFRYSPNLKVLEVGSNRLADVSVTSLMASSVNLLDISGNPEMQVSSSELKGIKTKKKICMIDLKGQNRSLLDLRTVGFDDNALPWQSGLSQTSGMRNKLTVSLINQPKFNNGEEGLFALFDGGKNDEVTRILSNKIRALVKEELCHPLTRKDYLKYAMLAAHRKLGTTGQKVGATGVICHIRKPTNESKHFELHVANVGDTEIVLCRRGVAVCLSKQFTVSDNKEELDRICKSDGIITEDNKINGVTHNTRLLGSSYLFPSVIPDPHTSKTVIQPEDQLIIIGNQGLWKSISHQEAVDEIINIPDPVLAAKRLQDLAQGYRSVENIGVLVVRLLLAGDEKMRMRSLLQRQFEEEQAMLAELKLRDIERDEMKRKAELEESEDSVPMDIVKLKGAKKRKMVNALFADKTDGTGEDSDENDSVEIKPFPKHITDSKDPTANWEIVLQKRLTEEVKNKELIYAMQMEQADQSNEWGDANWVTTTKLKDRIVTLPPDQTKYSVAPAVPPPPPQLHRRQIIPEAAQLSTESLEFQRELKHPLNVDRDAVLFHQMQLTRSKSHHFSSSSIDSTQSDPACRSLKEVSPGIKSSSHSIEVLIHGPSERRLRTQNYHADPRKFPVEFSDHNRMNSLGKTCPPDILVGDMVNISGKTETEQQTQTYHDAEGVSNKHKDSTHDAADNVAKTNESDAEKFDIRKLHNLSVEEEALTEEGNDNVDTAQSPDSSFEASNVYIESPFVDLRSSDEDDNPIAPIMAKTPLGFGPYGSNRVEYVEESSAIGDRTQVIDSNKNDSKGVLKNENRCKETVITESALDGQGRTTGSSQSIEQTVHDDQDRCKEIMITESALGGLGHTAGSSHSMEQTVHDDQDRCKEIMITESALGGLGHTAGSSHSMEQTVHDDQDRSKEIMITESALGGLGHTAGSSHSMEQPVLYNYENRYKEIMITESVSNGTGITTDSNIQSVERPVLSSKDLNKVTSSNDLSRDTLSVNGKQTDLFENPAFEKSGTSNRKYDMDSSKPITGYTFRQKMEMVKSSGKHNDHVEHTAKEKSVHSDRKGDIDSSKPITGYTFREKMEMVKSNGKHSDHVEHTGFENSGNSDIKADMESSKPKTGYTFREKMEMVKSSGKHNDHIEHAAFEKNDNSDRKGDMNSNKPKTDSAFRQKMEIVKSNGKTNDLITFRTVQAQKLSYKHHPKMAPPPPVPGLKGQQALSPSPNTMQRRSVIITYL